MSTENQFSGGAAVVTVTAVLMFLCLLPFELIPEIPVDIDSKPFFVPLALCALLPARMGLPIGLGVALGEGVRDLMEGYELDDPIGFFGYVAGFWAASQVYAIAPRNPFILMFGAILCGFVQGAIEASSFLLFGAEGLTVTIWSALGNTITHGFIWGAIPVLFLVPALRGKFEHYLGFPPQGMTPPPALTGGDDTFTPDGDAIAFVAGAAYRYPGDTEPAFQKLSVSLRPGDALGFVSDDPRHAEAAGLVVAGLAPRVTGGEMAGELRAPKSVSILSHDPRDQTTQPRADQEVAAQLLIHGGDPAKALEKARGLLKDVGVLGDDQRAMIWTLTKDQQFRVHIAVARAAEAELLIVQRPSMDISEESSAALQQLITDQLIHGVVIVTGTGSGPVMNRMGSIIRLSPNTAPQTLTAAELPESGTEGHPCHTDELDASDDGRGIKVPTLQTATSGWWHERDPRIKWFMFLSLLALIYIAPTWPWMAVMAAIGLILTLTARPPLLWLGFALFVQTPNILGLIFLPLLGEGSIDEEIGFGLRLGLGWVAAILFGISLLSTMEVPQMVAGLRGLGLPRRFCAIVGQVFVMIYLSFADLARISRDVRLSTKGFSLSHPFRLLGGISKLFVPSVIAVTRRSGVMAIAMDTKNNGRGTPPYILQAPVVVDGLLLLVTIATLIASIAARFGVF